MLKVRIVADRRSAPNEHKPDLAGALRTDREALFLQDRGHMAFTMEMVQHGVDAGFRHLIARSEYLLGS